MSDGVEVQGLEGLWPTDPHGGPRGIPCPWRPRGPGMKPEPEMLRLRLRYRGEEFTAVMARSAEGHRQIEELTEREQRDLDAFVTATPGWWIRLTGRRGGFFSAPYPTLEAAILGALSLPRCLLEDRRAKKKEVL